MALNPYNSRHSLVTNYQSEMPEKMMKADYNISYPEFVQLVENLWENTAPDIPLFPRQGQQYRQLPCVCYHMETKVPVPYDPKEKFRERITDENGKVYNIVGQKFDSIIVFSVMSESPKRAEQILEAFEDFMLEFTPVFKALGVSDIFYSRRVSDTEGSRRGADINERAASWRVTFEKIKVVEQSLFERIEAEIRLKRLQSYYEFEVTSELIATDQIRIIHSNKTPEVGDEIRVRHSFYEAEIPGGNNYYSLPGALFDNHTYLVSAVDGDLVKLRRLYSNDIVPITSTGRGTLYLTSKGDIITTLVDEGATPNG